MHVRKAYTFFMVPFSFDQQWDKSMVKDTIWGDSELTLEKDILYPHIQEFLQATANAENRQRYTQHKDQTYHIYSIKKKTENILLGIRLRRWNTFIKNQLTLAKENIPFKLLNKENELFSPKLIVCPIAKVGLLLFSIEMTEKDMTPEKLIHLNYALHKTDKQVADCRMLHGIEKLFKRVEQIDSEAQKNDTPLDGLIDQKLKKSATDQLKEINEIHQLFDIPAVTMMELVADYVKFSDKLSLKKEQLIDKERPQAFDRVSRILELLEIPISPNDPVAIQRRCWNISTLIQFLSGEFKSSITRFNTTRIHLFTYYQLDIDDMGTRAKEDLIRIIRCENENYLALEKETDNSAFYMQTFKNIYIGATVEGGAILTLLPSTNNEFIKDFATNSLSKRYLWIYIMVFLQRHTLLHLIQELTKVDDENLSVSLVKLKEKAEYLSAVKVNTHFTDVSDYTQHNQFYQFCMKNLCIKEHFLEIDEKMSLLNAVIRHKEEKRAEGRQNSFALVLALMAIASTAQDGSDFILTHKTNHLWGVFFTYFILIAAVYCFWSKDNAIVRFFNWIKKRLKITLSFFKRLRS